MKPLPPALLGCLSLVALLADCQAGKVEQDRLWSENRELRDQLDRAIATRDQAENQRSRLADQVRLLQSQLTQAHSAPTPILATAACRYRQSQGMDPRKMYASGFGEYHPRGNQGPQPPRPDRGGAAGSVKPSGDSPGFGGEILHDRHH